MTALALTNQSLTVRDALLGFSAFQHRSLNPVDRELAQASHIYLPQALRGHPNELHKGVDRKNAEVAFATSTLTASQTSWSQKFTTEDTTGQLLHWFRSY